MGQRRKITKKQVKHIKLSEYDREEIGNNLIALVRFRDNLEAELIAQGKPIPWKKK